jgi:hypothetical protein
MGALCLIGWTKVEKSNGIPTSVDHPGKPCGEKLSEDHYTVMKKFSERFRKYARTSLLKISKMSSSRGWSD